MSSHSPGPWCRDGYNMSSVIRCVVQRGHPDAKHLCGDYEVIARCEGNDWSANARLIAAAPEMLAALKHARNQIQHPDQMIDDAIAKATGEVA